VLAGSVVHVIRIWKSVPVVSSGGIIQLKEPSLAVVDDIVWTTEPALTNSIFTLDPTFPADAQVIVGFVLLIDSPPFGETTRIEPVMVKLALLISVHAGLVVLVIRTR
jgi:hypothetical protein